MLLAVVLALMAGALSKNIGDLKNDYITSVVEGKTITLLPITAVGFLTETRSTVTVVAPPVTTATTTILVDPEPTQEVKPATPAPSCDLHQTLNCGPGYCTDGTFIDQTSEVSPFATDCLRIAYNIRRGGTWRVNLIFQGHRQILAYKSCRFGVDGGYTTIGHEDVIGMINTAVEKFTRADGRVGAKGNTICYWSDNKDSALGKHFGYDVFWGMY